MQADVIKREAEDGTELFGLVHEADGERDLAVIYVHGLGSTARSHVSQGLAAVLPRAGIGVVRGDLREADLLHIDEVPSAGEARKGGGAYHPFTAGVADVDVWVREALERGYQRIVLFGHSLGSLRSTHYLVDRPRPEVVGLVLASTADLIAMHESRYTADELERFLSMAQERVAEGDGAEIMPPECSVGLMRQPISAAAYVDRFGPESSWDVMDLYGRGSDRAFRALSEVEVPILATFGTHKETVPGERVDGVFELLEQRATRAPSFTTKKFEGAEHFYLGFSEQLAEATRDWIAARVSR